MYAIRSYYATADCFIRFMHGSADANAQVDADVLLKSGVEYFFSMNGKKYISVVNASGSSNNKLYVTVMV